MYFIHFFFPASGIRPGSLIRSINVLQSSDEERDCDGLQLYTADTL